MPPVIFSLSNLRPKFFVCHPKEFCSSFYRLDVLPVNPINSIKALKSKLVVSKTNIKSITITALSIFINVIIIIIIRSTVAWQSTEIVVDWNGNSSSDCNAE